MAKRIRAYLAHLWESLRLLPEVIRETPNFIAESINRHVDRISDTETCKPTGCPCQCHEPPRRAACMACRIADKMIRELIDGDGSAEEIRGLLNARDIKAL